MADPTDTLHYIAPLDIGQSSGDVAGVVAFALTSAGAEVTQQSSDRIDAVFTSRLLRFKDDVSFGIDADNGLLHVRSASRTGHSDLGANRRRVTELFAKIGETLG